MTGHGSFPQTSPRGAEKLHPMTQRRRTNSSLSAEATFNLIQHTVDGFAEVGLLQPVHSTCPFGIAGFVLNGNTMMVDAQLLHFFGGARRLGGQRGVRNLALVALGYQAINDGLVSFADCSARDEVKSNVRFADFGRVLRIRGCAESAYGCNRKHSA
jgi:hypothetical protein